MTYEKGVNFLWHDVHPVAQAVGAEHTGKPAHLSIPLNEIDPTTVYTDGAAGYTDYPELAPVS